MGLCGQIFRTPITRRDRKDIRVFLSHWKNEEAVRRKLPEKLKLVTKFGKGVYSSISEHFYPSKMEKTAREYSDIIRPTPDAWERWCKSRLKNEAEWKHLQDELAAHGFERSSGDLYEGLDPHFFLRRTHSFDTSFESIATDLFEWLMCRQKKREFSNWNETTQRAFHAAAWDAMPLEQYEMSDHWRWISEKMRIGPDPSALNPEEHLIPRRCSVCSSSGPIEIHHRHYDHVGLESEQCLLVVCRGSHKGIHKTHSGMCRWERTE